MNTFVKTWEDRLTTFCSKHPELPYDNFHKQSLMELEVLELRYALSELQKASNNKIQEHKTERDALLLANKDLSNRFDALKVDYGTAQADAQRYNWIKENKISVTYEGMQKWTRRDGSTFVCSWSLASPSTGFLLQEDTLDKMVDSSVKFIPSKESK